MEDFIYARSYRDLFVYKCAFIFCSASRIAEDSPAENVAVEDPLTPNW
jgi:hypothetical protein